jgi:hypothetical protein
MTRPALTGSSRAIEWPSQLWARTRAASPAYWLLAVLLVIGVVVRIVAFTAWWPASTTLADAIPYSVYAATDPLGDPQHPVGYPALLALIGLFTRDVAVTIVAPRWSCLRQSDA